MKKRNAACDIYSRPLQFMHGRQASSHGDDNGHQTALRAAYIGR